MHKSDQEWIEERRSTIGSSDIAVLLGVCPYRTVLELWAEKTGKVPAFQGNANTRLGDLLEPYIARLFSDRWDKPVKDCNITFKHPKESRFSATPDFELEKEDALLETKNVGWRKVKEWSGDEPPLNFQAQVQWQLGNTQKKKGYIAAMVGGDPRGGYYDFPIDYDKSIFEMAAELAIDFLEKHVKTDIPPEAGPDDKKILGKLRAYKAPEVDIIDLTAELDDLVMQKAEISSYLRACKKKVKQAEDDKDHIENLIKQALINADVAKAIVGPTLIDYKKVDVKPKEGYSYHRLYYKKNPYATK